MDVLINLIVQIILQCLCTSNLLVVQFKYIQYFCNDKYIQSSRVDFDDITSFTAEVRAFNLMLLFYFSFFMKRSKVMLNDINWP